MLATSVGALLLLGVISYLFDLTALIVTALFVTVTTVIVVGGTIAFLFVLCALFFASLLVLGRGLLLIYGLWADLLSWVQLQVLGSIENV